MLEVMKKLSIGIDDNGNDLLVAHESLKQFYTLTQGKSEPNEDYMERFKESWNAAVASCGSTGCLVPDVMKTSVKYKNMSNEERIEAAKVIYFFCERRSYALWNITKSD